MEILKLKSTVTKTKNLLEEVRSRFKMAEENQ